VKKRKRATLSDDGSEPQEEFDIETDEYRPSESQPNSTDSCAGEVEDESEGEDRKRKRQKKDPRTIKRARFYRDFDFILGGKNGAETTPASNDPLLPSSVSRVFPEAWCPTDNTDGTGPTEMSPPFCCKILLREGPAHWCFEDRSSKEEGENER